jgi:hypothetical protein
LLAVIGIIAVLAMTLGTVMAKSGGKAGRTTCFNNKRQMQAACAMYSAEWNDWLPATAVIGSAFGWYNGNGTVTWGASDANTNPAYYTAGCIWPYFRELKVFKCPNDKIPSANGERIRSISMSGAICGDVPISIRANIQSMMGGWRIYSKTADLTVPGPANTWIFCDESMYSLNDGYLQCNVVPVGTQSYPDVPAAYDVGGNCFTFADAHVEYRKWVYHTKNADTGLLNTPYAYNQIGTGNPAMRSDGFDPDWKWLREHTSAP